MKYVDQTLFGAKDGNCWAACVASMLELPIDSVPHFCRDYAASDWFLAFANWLTPMGLIALTMAPAKTSEVFEWVKSFGDGIYWIGGGQSSRAPHAVIYLGDKMVHDPHPSREGLVKLEDATFIFGRDPMPRRMPA